MRRNGLCIVFFVIIAWFMSNACLAGTNSTESCGLAKMENCRNSENIQEMAAEEDSADIVSSILEVPGDIIDGIVNIPLDEIVSSTLQIPGDVVKFVADIPYDEIIWSTLEATAGIIEFIVDDGFFLGFFMGYYCHN